MGFPAGAIVPHAPLLDPAVGDGTDPAVAPVKVALSAVGDSLRAARAAVVVSSHGTHPGVYGTSEGSLAGFGIPGATVELRRAAAQGADMAERWGQPMLHEPLDHGITVPVRAGAVPIPVVAVALGEISGAHSGSGAGTDALDALASALATVELPVVVSAHTGAALSDRAPFLRSPAAVALEEELLHEARTDCAIFAHRATELAEVGHSCGASALALFGRLFAGRPLEVLDHRAPYGIGYLTALVR